MPSTQRSSPSFHEASVDLLSHSTHELRMGPLLCRMTLDPVQLVVKNSTTPIHQAHQQPRPLLHGHAVRTARIVHHHSSLVQHDDTQNDAALDVTEQQKAIVPVTQVDARQGSLNAASAPSARDRKAKHKDLISYTQLAGKHLSTFGKIPRQHLVEESLRSIAEMGRYTVHKKVAQLLECQFMAHLFDQGSSPELRRELVILQTIPRSNVFYETFLVCLGAVPSNTFEMALRQVMRYSTSFEPLCFFMVLVLLTRLCELASSAAISASPPTLVTSAWSSDPCGLPHVFLGSIQEFSPSQRSFLSHHLLTFGRRNPFLLFLSLFHLTLHVYSDFKFDVSFLYSGIPSQARVCHVNPWLETTPLTPRILHRCEACCWMLLNHQMVVTLEDLSEALKGNDMQRQETRLVIDRFMSFYQKD